MDLLNILDDVGFCELEADDATFLDIASTLGGIVKSRISSSEIDILTPISVEEAHLHSMSKKFGLGRLPFHTDGAYLKIPPKYILMRYLKGIPDPTPTEIFQLSKYCSKELLQYLKFDLWRVRGREMNFYTTIANNNLSKQSTIFRFDSNCMQPMDSRSKAFQGISEIINSGEIIQVKWKVNKLLILNNWSCLHSRPQVNQMENNIRILQRIMING